MHAWISGARLNQLPPPPNDAEELFATQQAIAEHPLIEERLGGLGGYKLGGAFAVAGEPCLWAPLFQHFICSEPGKKLSSRTIGLAAIEPEVAVIIGRDLLPRADGRPHSVDDVWKAVDRVALIFEVCGKRLTPAACEGAPKIGTLADTLSSGGIVIGTSWAMSERKLSSNDVSKIEVELIVNGAKVAEGSTSLCPMGGPAEAVTYLANHLNARGMRLKQGELVATGQACNTKKLAVGDVIQATFKGLGSIEMVIQP